MSNRSPFPFGTVCSGIEAPSVAWHDLGWESQFFSEIEPFPCSLLKHYYPHIKNYGDLNLFRSWGLAKGLIRLLAGGTPCQAFSVAGLRKGLDDPRGNLALIYLGLAESLRPDWLDWENVPGVLSSNGGRDFGAFLGALVKLGYGFAYRVLDAQYFGVPQRRRRGNHPPLLRRASLQGPRQLHRDPAPAVDRPPHRRGRRHRSPDPMKQYLHLLREILEDGTEKTDRTGTGTISLFGAQFRHDMSRGFPLLTTKKLHLKSIIHELLWIISGSTNVRDLQANGVTIWDEWADENGDLGRVYGAQWRHWITRTTHFGEGAREETYIDQLHALVLSLRTKPDSRRHIVTAWNPSDVESCTLPPCHAFFQCNVRPHPLHVSGQCTDMTCSFHPASLDLHMYQRSADVFLGVPFNIASYALLLQMLAHVCRYQPGHLIISYGDVHIYKNHVDQVRQQLDRAPVALPSLKILNQRKEITDFQFADFHVSDYNPQPSIKAPVAV